MVTPEDYLKFQIKSALNLEGAAHDEITLNRWANAVWAAITADHCEVHWMSILVDMQQARGKAE